jgi:hypothetical protein
MAIKVGGTTVVDDSRNITGISISGLTTPLSAAQGGTGITSLGTGVATLLGTPSSANLAAAITDETGSGALVFGTSPAITTSLTTGSSSFDLINTTATTVNFAKAATALSMGAATGSTTVNHDMIITGNLQVTGTTTTVSSATLTTADKVIIVASGSVNSAAADGAGISVAGANATFLYNNTSNAWSSSQDITIASGKVYEINGTSVLSSSTLGSGVTASSLTSVGTIATGVWNGSEISTTYTAAKVTSVNGSTGAVSGLATTAGTLAQFGATTSSQLLGVISDETGSGALVFANSPTLVSPALGTPSSGTLSSCTVDGTDAVGFRNVPQNSQSASYTAVLADSGKHIFHPASDANARTFTIPSNASVAYPIGTVLAFSNMTSQVVTISINSDTMYLGGQGTTGNRSLAQYGVANALKITSTSWIITGTGLT